MPGELKKIAPEDTVLVSENEKRNETYLIWQEPICCDTPLSRLARRTFEYSLARVTETAPKSPLLCANTEPLRYFRCAQVDLGYCNTV